MKLNPIFTDNAVLQANKPISIFGNGRGSATLKIAGATFEISSERENWCTELPAMDYGGPYTLEFSSSEETKTLKDIYVGEVFLFSGQSNMAFKLKDSNTPEEYYSSSCPNLHYVEITESDVIKPWRDACGDFVADWSALSYIAGKECALKNGVAVGIICCAKGASVIESWMPENALQSIGICLTPEQKYLDHYHEIYGRCNPDAFLYKQRIMRVIPYTLRGVVWYQGESDASEDEGKVYCRELEELIRIWRREFKDESLPFIVVQIADTAARIRLGEGWRLIQKAQLEISSIVPNVYTVISADVSETDDIHPKSKHQLALRIAGVITEKIIQH